MTSLFVFGLSIDVNIYEFNCRFVKQQISHTVQNASLPTLLKTKKNYVGQIACSQPIQADSNI